MPEEGWLYVAKQSEPSKIAVLRDLIAERAPVAEGVHLATAKDSYLEKYFSEFGIADVDDAVSFLRGQFCGWVDPSPPAVGLASVDYRGRPFTRRVLTFRADATNCNLSQDAVDASVARSFAAWHMAIPALTFVHRPDLEQTDFTVRFGGDKLDERFTGPSGVVGSAAPPDGDKPITIAVDMAETWHTIDVPTLPAVTWLPLDVLLVHEIGHALGLGHDADPNHVMFPSMLAGDPNLPVPTAIVDSGTSRWAWLLYGWEPMSDVGFDSYWPPALASAQASVVGLWSGTDNKLADTVFTGSRVGEVRRLSDRGSSHRPGLASDGEGFTAVWKGIGDDAALYAANLAAAGGQWSQQEKIEGAFSSYGPTIASGGGATIAAWRGAADEGIYWAFRGSLGGDVNEPGVIAALGDAWSGVRAIPMVGSSGPMAMVWDGAVFHLYWQGMGQDRRVWHSTLDALTLTWLAQNPVRPVNQIEDGQTTLSTAMRHNAESISTLSACLLPNGEIVLALGLPHDSLTFRTIVSANGGREVWYTQEFPTPFESFSGQAVCIASNKLVVVGRRSSDRVDTRQAQATLQL